MNRIEPPLELPLVTGLGRVHRLRWWLDGDGHPAVTLTMPAGCKLELDAERAHCQRQDDGQCTRLTFEETAMRWENPRRLERLAAALENLPDGTRLELDTGEGYAFEGPVSAGRWSLQGCSSAVSREVLERALELSRQCEEDDCLEAGTPELAEAAAAGIAQNWAATCEFRVEGSRILVSDLEENRNFQILFAAEIFLASPEYQQAFPGLTETLAERSGPDPLVAAMGQISAVLNQHMGIKTGELVHAGKKARFHRSDLGHVKWLVPADLELADAEFARVGFHPVGDLTADTLAGALMRGYCRPGGTAWGALTVGLSGEFIREFVTCCEDDSHLTTTTLPQAEEKESRKVYKVSRPDLDVPGLLEAHQAELQRRGLKPMPAEGDLVKLCQVVDHFLTRWM